MSKLLVAYVSETGSTKEVAEKVADILRSKGHEVTIESMKSVINLADFEGIVLGAPVHGMSWDTGAQTFVEDNQATLQGKPVALFALGIMVKYGRNFFRNKVNQVLLKPSKLVKPIDAAVFQGVSGQAMPKPFRFMFGLKEDLPTNQEDWPRIQSWSETLAEKF